MANANYLTQQRNRKLTLAYQLSSAHEPLSIPTEPSYDQQRNFERTLAEFLQKHLAIKHTAEPFSYRLAIASLEQSALSSVIEVFLFLVA